MQYVDDLIISIVNTEEVNIPETSINTVFKTMYSLGRIGKDFYQLYEKINSTRNHLIHKIIKDPGIRAKFTKIAKVAHKKDLFKLIKEVDNFYIDYARENPVRFISISKFSKSIVQRQRNLMQILSHQINQKINISGFGRTKEELELAYKKEFYAKLEKRLSDIFSTKK